MGAPSDPWVLRSVQFAAGTSLWLHGSSLLPMAVPLDPVAAYLLGLPTGWAAWAGLLLIMSQATAAVTNEALQVYLETLLRNGHQAGKLPGWSTAAGWLELSSSLWAAIWHAQSTQPHHAYVVACCCH